MKLIVRFCLTTPEGVVEEIRHSVVSELAFKKLEVEVKKYPYCSMSPVAVVQDLPDLFTKSAKESNF